MPTLNILLIGQPADVVALSEQTLALGMPGVRHFPELKAALEWLSEAERPATDAILLCEPRPGCWTDRELHALRCRAPLARIIRLSGVWCDGQGRSGRPPEGSFPIAWHQLPARIQRELEQFEHGEPSVFNAPPTATAEDLHAVMRAVGFSGNAARKTVAIVAPRAAAAATWAELCLKLGHRAEIIASDCENLSATADVVLWDCDPRELADVPLIRRFIARAATASVLAITGFPRPADVQLAQRHGIAAVLPKPLLAAELAWHLSAAVRGRCSLT